MMSNEISYGFIMETESQVMRHLDHHINMLPKNDKKSQCILQQMYKDEFDHKMHAKTLGGIELPLYIKFISFYFLYTLLQYFS